MAYADPIGPGLLLGRVDEGVDFSGAGPLYAMGDGVIDNVAGRGWPGGVYIQLQLTGSGPYQGRYVYYAENIAPQVVPGQRVRAGDLVGWARGVYPSLELGWGSGTPGLAAAAGHYTEGVPTPEGRDFLAVLTALRHGGPLPSGPGGTGTPAGPEPSVTGALVPAVAAMDILARRRLAASSRRAAAYAQAASRLYRGR